MRKKMYRVVSVFLMFVLVFSSVEMPVSASEPQEIELQETEPEETEPEETELQETEPEETEPEETEQQETEPEETEPQEAEPELPEIPLLNYQPIPGEGDYESIREHLGEDAILPVMAVELPEVYNPVESENYLPPTRSQSPYGSCWAHSVMAAAEIGLVKKGGQDPNGINLSELQLAYFSYYSPQTDPLELVQGDSNTVVLDPANKVKSFMDRGGNVNLAKKVLQGWISAGEDSGELAFGNAATVIQRIDDDPPGLEDRYAFDDIFHMQNYYNISISDTRDIKEAIMDYGAVAVSYYDAQANRSGSYGLSYYCPTPEGVNHAVAIVGWDDTYSADNFKTRPSRDGAWLIRNSWWVGEFNGRKYTEYTYFWMSYEDQSLTGGVVFMWEPASNYDNNYHYDGAAIDRAVEIPSGGKVANVYKAKGATGLEMLKAVSFDTDSSNVEYEIAIYKNLEDANDPESGVICSIERGSTTYSGYYTIPLTEYVPLRSGETFSVVIALSHADDSAVKISQEMTYSFSWTGSIATSNAGESFIKNSTWTDAGANGSGDRKGNLRIKAFTENLEPGNPVNPASVELNKSNLTLKSGETVTLWATVQPNDATNKDVIWSSADQNIAQVSKGKVTATGVGKTMITATHADDQNLKAVCAVEVVPGVTIKNQPTEYNDMAVGASLSLQAQILPEDCAADYTLNWESSDTAVATVSQTGELKAVGGGTAQITVSAVKDSSIKDTIIKDTIKVKVTHLDYVSPYVPEFAEDNSSVTLSWMPLEGADHYKASLLDPDNMNEVLKSAETKKLSCVLQYPLKTGKKYRYMVLGFDEEETLFSRNRYYFFYAPCKITYQLNGGTNHSDNPSYVDRDYIYSLKDATRKGYKFDGWYTDPEFAESTKIERIFFPNEDITLYAKWTPNPYTIRYNGNGAEGAMSDQVCEYDTKCSLRKNTFKKTGNTFMGWNTQADGKGIAYADEAEVENLTDIYGGLVVLYAQWEGYTITYNLNGGTNAASNPSVYTSSTETIVLADPTKTGHTFEGWYSDDQFTLRVTKIEKGSKGDKTLYAKWRKNTYTISYDGNGETEGELSNQVCAYGTTYNLKKTLSKNKDISSWAGTRSRTGRARPTRTRLRWRT